MPNALLKKKETPKYKALFVREDTHQALKLLSVKEKLTFDALLKKLLWLKLHGD